MAIALTAFIVALLGIGFLFAQKALETSRGVALFPSFKSRMDTYAHEGKMLIEKARVELEHLPPTVARLSRIVLHQSALGAAAAARYVERELHRLADMVSHKRAFERREPRNEYLKQVSEHPMRDSRSSAASNDGSGLDTTESNGHNG